MQEEAVTREKREGIVTRDEMMAQGCEEGEEVGVVGYGICMYVYVYMLRYCVGDVDLLQ